MANIKLTLEELAYLKAIYNERCLIKPKEDEKEDFSYVRELYECMRLFKSKEDEERYNKEMEERREKRKKETN